MHIQQAIVDNFTVIKFQVVKGFRLSGLPALVAIWKRRMKVLKKVLKLCTSLNPPRIWTFLHKISLVICHHPGDILGKTVLRLLSVLEVLTKFYSNLLYRMGKDIFDIQCIKRGKDN